MIVVEVVTGVACLASGFIAGLIYGASRIPHMLARLTPDEFRILARTSGEIRRGA